MRTARPAYWKIVPKSASAIGRGGSTADSSAGPVQPTIRIATFHLGRFDEAKLANPRVSDVLVHLFPRFELMAVQGVRGKNQGVLIRLVEQINAASGRTYDFATCPTQQRDALEHYSAFVFDRQRIDVDRTTVHFVEDRLGRFRIKPLVGLFRVRGPDPAEAFTFTLDQRGDRPRPGGGRIGPAGRSVSRRPRQSPQRRRPVEDDIILLGDLESDDQHLGQLGKLLGVTRAPLRHAHHNPRHPSAGQHPAGPPGHERSSPAAWKWLT